MIDRIAWGVLALIHLMPAVALLAPGLIGRLYGVDAANPIFPLLHHRAALFAVILLICLWAAVDPNVRRLAVVATGLSMLSFLVIYWTSGQPETLRTIAIADLVGLPFLAIATWRAFASA